jgi:hypothetical protein
MFIEHINELISYIDSPILIHKLKKYISNKSILNYKDVFYLIGLIRDGIDLSNKEVFDVYQKLANDIVDLTNEEIIVKGEDFKNILEGERLCHLKR